MTARELPELLPCPFCGGAATCARDSGNEVWSQSWSAGCVKCSVLFKELGSNSWNSNAKEDAAAERTAIARWNTRAAPRVSEGMVEALAKFIVRKEANNCKTLNEAMHHQAQWRRAIPEAREMLEAAVAQGDGLKCPRCEQRYARMPRDGRCHACGGALAQRGKDG